MNKSLIFFCAILCFFLSSCLTNKDLVYLQGEKKELNNEIYYKELAKPYRVQIGDVLKINVKALDDELVDIFNPTGDGGQTNGQAGLYFTGFTIDLHGDIEFPILGRMNVLGLTTEEIEERVKVELLKKYFKDTADVFITVKLSGLRYVTIGEISSKGVKTLFQDRVNIIEAIANAGDILPAGNRKDVLIVRQYPDGQRIHHIDLTTIEAINSPYYYIKPNDIILVKPLKRKAWGVGAGQNAVQTISTIASIFSMIVSTYFLAKNLN